MGDLISRSALIESIINHGNDIKSDVPMIEDIYQTAHKHIIDLVEIQPTAYDVEKVVAELEEEREIAYADFDEYAYKYELDLTDNDDWFYRGLSRAMNVVKRGGAE